MVKVIKTEDGEKVIIKKMIKIEIHEEGGEQGEEKEVEVKKKKVKKAEK